MNGTLSSNSNLIYGGAASIGLTVVRLQAGFVGQVTLANQILWETKPHKTADAAVEAAQKHVEKRLRKVFA